MKNKINVYNFFPGLIQYKNGQKKKALVMAVAFYSCLLSFIIWGSYIFPRIFNETIGFEAGMNGDNSLNILISFGFLILLIGIIIGLYILSFKDGRNPTIDNKLLKDKLRDEYLIYLILVPAIILVVSFVIIPIFLTILISFTNYNLMHQPPFNLISWEGFSNYKDFLLPPKDGGIDYNSVFGQVLKWTIVWTVIATTSQIILGTITAFVFNQEDLRGAKFVMPLFLLTWAIPSFILIGMFSQMFSDSTGIINSTVLPFLNHLVGGHLYVGLEHVAEVGMDSAQKAAFTIQENSYGIMEVPWKTNTNLTKLAILIIQPIIGFPYVFTLVLGTLKSIPDSLYDAAKIDGASPRQRVSKITLPLVIISTLPVLITQYTFNFNNFGMIYLFNQGGPGTLGANAGTTDILMSWVYKIMTGSSPDYGMSAAIALIMSLFTVTISMIVFLKSNTFSKEDMR